MTTLQNGTSGIKTAPGFARYREKLRSLIQLKKLKETSAKSRATAQRSGAGATERRKAWAKCKSLAGSKDILQVFRDDLKHVGLVGENRNAALIFLAIITRMFERPLPIAVKGDSAGGKSFLVKCVLRFIPAEAFYELTGMSDRSPIFEYLLEAPLPRNLRVRGNEE